MTESAALSLNLKLQVLEVRRREDVAGAVRAARDSQAEALNVSLRRFSRHSTARSSLSRRNTVFRQSISGRNTAEGHNSRTVAGHCPLGPDDRSFAGGIEHGADDLIVAGTPAEVAGEPVARLGLRRARIAVQEGFGGDQQARRAEAALQGRVLQEFPLQRMEIMAARHALDRLDGAAFGLDRKHQARADQAAVDGHAAGAAITGAASLLAAGQMQLVAQHIQQGELRLAQELGGLAVDLGRYVMLAHRRFPARS